jgi:hypothetical protein
VGFADQSARLFSGTDVFDLQSVPAASGARYSDGQTPETAVWSKGNTALVTVKGRDLPECQPVITPAALPLTAGLGGALGGAGAIMLGWSIGAEGLARWPLRGVRLALAAGLMVAAIFIGLTARFAA